jgi:small subunit ribosomal protein S12e
MFESRHIGRVIHTSVCEFGDCRVGMKSFVMPSEVENIFNFKISIVPHRPPGDPSPVSLVRVQAKHSQMQGPVTAHTNSKKYNPSEFTLFLITTTNLFFEDRKSFKNNQDGRQFPRDPGARLIFAQSDAEDNASNAPEVAEAEEVEVSGDAASKGQMSVLDALKGVLKLALMHDGLARGLREASKALDRRQAHMCVLNEACEEEAYKKLVVALCSEHKIPLIKVPDGKQLGEWAGLCKCRLENLGGLL